jgi:hypothetical protein
MFAPYVAAYVYACRLGYPDQTYLGTVLAEHHARWGFHVFPFLRDLWYSAGLCLLPAVALVPSGLRSVRWQGGQRWLAVWLALAAAPFLFAVTSQVTVSSGYHNHLLVVLSVLVAAGALSLRPPWRVLVPAVLVTGTALATVAGVYQVTSLQGVLWPRATPPYGALVRNHGLKTAGYWVRTNLAPTDKVFVAHDPALAYWYFGRDCLTGGYTSRDLSLTPLAEHAGEVQAAVLTWASPEYPDAMLRALGFRGKILILSHGQEAARLYVRRPVSETLDAAVVDRLYDATFRTAAQIIPPGSPYVPGKRAPGE